MAATMSSESQAAASPTTPGLSGQGLNTLSNEADSRHRLLNLTPTPVWEHIRTGPGERRSSWGAGYSLEPAVEVWAERVRLADAEQLVRAVGVVGATSAGKSWLVGKLLGDDGPKPSQLEEFFDGMTLQSMTSDINLYADDQNQVYFLDFEGTYGTQPTPNADPDIHSVMARCGDGHTWEIKRRQALKECFQPSVAYLTCNVVIFLSREKLVCSRAMEECEHFARAANARVVSALPPALILVQNCCRPSEGLFNPEQCTAAFVQTHLTSGAFDWQKYFRSIDCFCIPDETLVCKRSGFDGEDVCREVIAALKHTLRFRIEEDVAFKLQHQVQLSQLQWFSVVSALCRIVNDSDKVQMSSLYMHVAASGGELGELKSVFLQLMGGKLKCSTVAQQLQVCLSIIARFVVRRGVSGEEADDILRYLRGLFPCGSIASDLVVCFDQADRKVTCGQMRLFHTNLHRSSTFVRTVDADWLQGLAEWLRGGVTHAWSGEFQCHPAFREFDSEERLRAALAEEVEDFKLQKCLEGLAPQVGSPWVLKAHESLLKLGMRIRRDSTRMCVICMTPGVPPGFFSRILTGAGNEHRHLPACAHCSSILERHSLCQIDTRVEVRDLSCESCKGHDTSSWVTVRPMFSGMQHADHRLFPCRCSVCKLCGDIITKQADPACPLCGQFVRWMVDERALVKGGWPAAVRRDQHRREQHRDCDTCGARRK